MDEQQSLNQLLSRVIKERPVSEAFRQRLQSRLRQVDQQQRWRNWSVKFALAAGLFLLLWNLAIPPRASQLALDLVGHHETCWSVPSSDPRRQQYQAWVHSHPGTPLTKADKLGQGLQLFDRRGCPVLGATRSPHWMYRDRQGALVSVYLFPLSDLSTSTTLPQGIRDDSCRNYHVLTWTDADCLWAMVAQAPTDQMEQWIRQSALTGYEPRQLGRIIAAVGP